MKLALTITMNNGEFKENILVNSELKIENMMDILYENSVLTKFHKNNYKIKSIRQGKFINKHLSFEEAKIYTGDILEIFGLRGKTFD